MNYKIDEGNVRFPDIKKMNENVTRIYFDQAQEEREDMEGKSVTIYTAKFVDSLDQPASALEGIKAIATAEIVEFDSSSAINEFFLNGVSMWLDNATRDKLAKRLDVDAKSGLSVTKVFYEGVVYTLPIQAVEGMLLQLEQYARDCFDKTNEHISAIQALNDVDAVANYDYTKGYPTKLEFIA